MKKTFLILLATIAFACNNTADNTTERETTADEPVEIGAGEKITPQVELDSGTNKRLDVDTVSRKTIEKQQQ
ncbi:hypothetical protein [Pontibacter mangrovi]|uniref:Uncharacterized protein n=1 Tax=Pontibacter mangrovi TaxID=2589816 RepID=A0A501W5Z9_9BACT|nr:hypothetical protein [Pontibacter mangrovi]TPE44055.1 hypothetical protein FJM65_11585 [Pontibacter mangrovi]